MNKELLKLFGVVKKTIPQGTELLTADPLGKYFYFDRWFGHHFSHLDQRFS